MQEMTHAPIVSQAGSLCLISMYCCWQFSCVNEGGLRLRTYPHSWNHGCYCVESQENSIKPREYEERCLLQEDVMRMHCT